MRPSVAPCAITRTCVEMQVIGDDERPIRDALIELRSGGRALRDKTDAQGRCVFEGLPTDAPLQFALVDLDSAAWEILGALALKSDLVDNTAIAAWAACAQTETGPSVHEVVAGECLLRIAHERGFLAETLWSHPANATTWSAYHSKGVLSPGMRIHIPPRRPRWESAEGGHLYLVHRIGVPVVMSIRVLDAFGNAYARCPYALALRRANGEDMPHILALTDARGFVRSAVPPDIVSGSLLVGTPDGAQKFVLTLDVGALAPANERAGALARLVNLGYRGGGSDRARPDDQLLAAFRIDHVGAAGPLDDATAAALVASHLS